MSLFLASIVSLALASGATAVGHSDELTFKGGGGQSLVGTFEAPDGNGPFPAVLLLPGSGPTDRDGNSILLKDIKIDMLKQIADALAAKGIASFRFDKRAIMRYKADWPKTVPEISAYFSYRHHIEDAEAAFATLRAQPSVDPKRTALLGHSEGALFTVQIASELPNPPTAIVSVGGMGRSMGPVIRDQVAAGLAKSPGVDPKPYLDYIDAANAALAAGKALPPNQPAGLGSLYNPAYLDLLQGYCSADPAALAAKFGGPALLINGEDDTQVSATKDTPLLEKALKGRKTGTVETHIIPGASHCLKQTTATNHDVFAGPIVPSALGTIVSWLQKELSA